MTTVIEWADRMKGGKVPNHTEISASVALHFRRDRPGHQSPHHLGSRWTSIRSHLVAQELDSIALERQQIVGGVGVQTMA